MACRRRSSRPAWWPGYSPNWPASARGAGSRSASPMTCPAAACPTTRRWTSSRPARCARSSSASARTGPSARTRTRSRFSAPRKACTRKVISSTTRRSRVRRPCRTCASGRGRSGHPTWWVRPASSAVIISACWTGSTCSAGRRRARHCCSTARSHRIGSGLRRPVQEKILAKRIEVYAIDAGRIARDVGLAGRTNTILQTCVFAISGVLPREEAIGKIKSAIAKTYGRRGTEVVKRNLAGVDRAVEALHQIEVPGRVTSTRELPAVVPASAPEFVRTVTAAMMAGHGDDLPVSALPVDGTYPSGTTAYEKRNISELVAEWDPDLCIQCGNCSFVCPHSVIRSTYYDESLLKEAPSDFKSAPLDARGLPDTRFTLQVYVEDCTGCELCVQACPVGAPDNPERKAINLAAREPLVAVERDNVAFFETLPVADRC